MAKAKRNDETVNSEVQDVVVNLRRIANLLALILTKGEEETEKIKTLAAVGYSPSEIAKLLGRLPVSVRTALHRARKDSQNRQ